MSPAKLCQKHSKPFPCGRCRIENAQKPPQQPPASTSPPEAATTPELCVACGEPTEDPRKNLCKREPCIAAREERKAQATAGMDEKIRNARPATEKSSVTKTVTEAETSDGPRIAKTTNNIDADDLRDVADRSKPDKRTPVTNADKPKQPAYLKSVAQPIIPILNDDGTVKSYGHDENDRPIVQGRTDQQILTDTLSVLSKQPETKQELATRREPQPLPVPTLNAWGNERRQSEKQKIEPGFVYFPGLLKINRPLLVKLLDATVATERQPTSKIVQVLKSNVALKARIAELEVALPKAEQRIAELKTQIKEEEEVIHSMSARVQKLRRPDDVLDQKTREMYKREAKNNIKKHEQEKSKLHAFVKRSNLDKLKERLSKWDSDPKNYYSDFQMGDVPIPFRDKFTLPRIEFKNPGSIPPGYKCDIADFDGEPSKSSRDLAIGAYIQQVYRYDYDSSVDSNLMIWREWKIFENEIVLQAIGWGLIRLSKKLVRAHPELFRYVRETTPEAYHSGEGENGDDQDHTEETTFIIKTGGGHIGGGIYGNKNVKMKTFEKYDQNYRRGNGPTGAYGGNAPDNFYGGMDSGDLDERGSDE